MNAIASTFAPTALLAAGEPAGGAAVDQVAIATGAALILSAAIAWLGMGHRSGKVPYLGRAADLTERVSGLPGWAALPSALSAASLLVALLGMYWDISLHIDAGRDAGPLANPAHYLILAGLFGVFTAGYLAICLPKERPGPAAVRIAGDWYAPVGGLLIAACGAFALVGFPLDDVWHRLFGQDVTLWGPTHLMLIGGAGMTLIGQAVLLVEGMRARDSRRSGTEPLPAEPALLVRLRRVGLMGGLLIGLSTFQGEFDFGVPQFRLVLEPMLLALAASVHPGLRPDLDRPGGRTRRRRFLHRDPRRAQPDRRRGVRADRASSAALPRRGSVRRAGGAGARSPAAWPSERSRAWGSEPWASPRNGAGPRSRCRTPGRRTCFPKR